MWQRPNVTLEWSLWPKEDTGRPAEAWSPHRAWKYYKTSPPRGPPTRGNQWDATLKDEGQAEGTLEANFSKAGRVFDELQTHQRSTMWTLAHRCRGGGSRRCWDGCQSAWEGGSCVGRWVNFLRRSSVCSAATPGWPGPPDRWIHRPCVQTFTSFIMI